MKIVIALLTVFASLNVIAAEKLPQDAISLQPVVGQVVGFTKPQNPNCPQSPGIVCLPPIASVKLSFGLSGCMNRLGPVTYNVREIDGMTIVTVSAVEIVSKKSATVKCFVQPTAQASINIGPGVFNAENTTVEFLAATALHN